MAPHHDPAVPADSGAQSGTRTPGERPVVLDRVQGPHGEVALRRHGDVLQIIANGCFLMDTSGGGRSERRLVRSALAALDGRPAPGLLIGGLGAGFSLEEATAGPRWGRITVVEREEAVLRWHEDGGPLAGLTAVARADPRTALLHDGLLEHLRAPGPAYDAMCLDIDNGPGWTVTPDNAGLYSREGLAACRERLTPGGVLAVWSSHASVAFENRLREAGFGLVRTEEVRAAHRAPDVLFLASHHLASHIA